MTQILHHMQDINIEYGGSRGVTNQSVAVYVSKKLFPLRGRWCRISSVNRTTDLKMATKLGTTGWMSQLRCSCANHKPHNIENQNHLLRTLVHGSSTTAVFCYLDRSSTFGLPTVLSSLSGRMPAGWKKMSATEIALANSWYNEDSIKPSEIARRLKRDKSVITRHVIKKIVKKKQGRPVALSTVQVDFLASVCCVCAA